MHSPESTQMFYLGFHSKCLHRDAIRLMVLSEKEENSDKANVVILGSKYKACLHMAKIRRVNYRRCARLQENGERNQR